MALRIDRRADSRVLKCILHRIADIPGGVTVSNADLVPGTALLEGTPIGLGSDGMYHVVKVGTFVTVANATAVKYEVSKGMHLKVGDFFGVDGTAGKQITAIDRTDAAKDVITVGTTLGKAVEVGDMAVEYAGANKTLKVQPLALVGSNMDVVPNDNIFVDAWLFAVVRKSNAPGVTPEIATALKGVIYI